ncbi:MAG TPA: hypothetical protein VJT81_06585 [Burkholderiales bacterium]|nr:hypothetical protein [Burkholderiales bacterium]
MAHHRETLVEGLRDILRAAGTTIGSRFYRGRQLPVEDTELPAGLVYQGDEQSPPDDVRSLKRRGLETFIELHHKSDPATLNDPDIETKLNELAREVEVALEADFTLGGRCLFFIHVGTLTRIEDGDSNRGTIRLQLNVQYRTLRTDPSIQG